ncbi:glycoside hydrolase family 25 protein [Novosphingobium sp. KCTC 2891]|uniref:glycoside hydrolase family 25 protein n=1 Tax=Novosphingobium sp. KCTC 2891 TaxID=2989730 RepID=UPI002221E661|nr:glycoside hydrolase family 25 protein [Novosphingobium sp. KCTC 2891]MCW1382231.1 glycoside hydrolase family 25 protein [Novosphingobium sp. KCTC 2891]
MAKKGKAARKRLLAALVLVLLVAGGAAWWEARAWRPDRTRFPVQGAWLDGHDGTIDWRLLKAAGADFVYLTASEGPDRRDPAFGEGIAAVRERGMQAGAVHVYDLCAPADAQAANFVTTVPREKDLLPPAIALDIDSRSCPEAPGEAAMQSELTTFLNQIEKHVGKPAILMVSRGIENRYHLAAVIDRNIWVQQDYLAPGYAGRPWVMWTATRRLRVNGAEGPVRWVVVQP